MPRCALPFSRWMQFAARPRAGQNLLLGITARSCPPTPSPSSRPNPFGNAPDHSRARRRSPATLAQALQLVLLRFGWKLERIREASFNEGIACADEVLDRGRLIAGDLPARDHHACDLAVPLAAGALKELLFLFAPGMSAVEHSADAGIYDAAQVVRFHRDARAAVGVLLPNASCG